MTPALLFSNLKLVISWVYSIRNGLRGPDRSSMQTKLSSLISKSHHSLASVFLAFSLLVSFSRIKRNQ
jgi:hypothetical protein